VGHSVPSKKIKGKLGQNNAVILKADKGNSIVIEYTDNYHNKIQDFISNNEFQIAKKDPTKRFQRNVRAVIRECQFLIGKEKRPKYVNLNPSAPTIRGQLKVHKDNCPVRPVINWQNAPAYKLAKLLNKLIATYIPLPYVYNVKNTVQLMKDLTEIPYNQELKLISFDIDNTYPNIPTDKLINIIKEMCSEQALEDNITNELTKITQTTIEQNYFVFQNKNYIQQKGLAMGAPSSSVLAEIYLQNLE
jgi:hypothetical protein